MTSVTVQMSPATEQSKDSMEFVELLKDGCKLDLSDDGYEKVKIDDETYLELVFNKNIRYSKNLENLEEISLECLLDEAQEVLERHINTDVGYFEYSFVFDNKEIPQADQLISESSSSFTEDKISMQKLSSGRTLIDVQPNKTKISV